MLCWDFRVLIKAARLFTKLNWKKKKSKKKKKQLVSIHSRSSLLIFMASVSASLLIEIQSNRSGGTLEETLLPTWNCQNHRRKLPNPKPNWEPISFNYKHFVLSVVPLLRMQRMAGGLPTHAHSQYVILPFLYSVVGRETRQSDKMPTETAEDRCQVKYSAHPHRSTASLCLSPPLADSLHHTLGSFDFIWLVQVRWLVVSAGKRLIYKWKWEAWIGAEFAWWLFFFFFFYTYCDVEKLSQFSGLVSCRSNETVKRENSISRLR